MPKLPPELNRRLRSLLRRPMPPRAMQRLVRYMDARLGFWALVQDTPFRDAYVAAAFATERAARLVRLGDDPPDLYLSGVRGCTAFEVVETYRPNRRRSDEYRRLAIIQDKQIQLGEAALSDDERRLLAPYADPDDGEWQARADRAPALLAAAASQKAAKGYPTDWGLLILLDLGGFVPSDSAVLRHLREGTAPAACAFAEVWVLWHGTAHLVWKDGAPKDVGLPA